MKNKATKFLDKLQVIVLSELLHGLAAAKMRTLECITIYHAHDFLAIKARNDSCFPSGLVFMSIFINRI